MTVQHQQEKTSNAVLFFLQNTKHCGITKLLKLLFFLDFTHFKQTGRSVTGQEYRAWPKGPAPSDVWREIKGGAPTFLSDAVTVTYIPNEESGKTFASIKPKRPYDGRFFSKREKQLLANLAEIYVDATTEQMVEISHLRNSPWDRTLKAKGPSAKIDYMLALDGKQPELPIEEIKERLAEEQEEQQLMGT